MVFVTVQITQEKESLIVCRLNVISNHGLLYLYREDLRKDVRIILYGTPDNTSRSMLLAGAVR